ncbi:hypothetical protein [Paenibacillus massiliensis]|uniref:hypothetical protein n=1 Tax=Paenibacillus massiliensis TaxID=225917 RepID=UPI0004092E08|nr:hypothetical protein [Paenibacillus massiliensis]
MKVLILIRAADERSEALQLEGCQSYLLEKGWESGEVVRVGAQEEYEFDSEQLAPRLDQATIVLAPDLSCITDSIYVFHRFLRQLHAQRLSLHTVKDGEVVDFSPIHVLD